MRDTILEKAIPCAVVALIAYFVTTPPDTMRRTIGRIMLHVWG
ncbi:hypothetical protein [Schlesneria paludicola]|nr:hypothetical protein [Schlesneria paludicola]